MADLIEVDYGKLEEVHKKFTQQGEAFAKTIRDVRSRMEPLVDGGWTGEHADAFFKEMGNIVLPACNRLHKAFNEAAAASKRIGDTVQNAEQDAVNAFKL